MLNAYQLAEAVNNLSFGYDEYDGPAEEFYGGLQESLTTFDYMIMTEETDMLEFEVSSDEIIIESTLENMPGTQALLEATEDAKKSKLRAFIDKIIKGIQGILIKIRNFFSDIYKKISEFFKSHIKFKKKDGSTAEGTVEQASDNLGDLDTTIESKKWDWNLIDKKIPEGCGKIVSKMSVVRNSLQSILASGTLSGYDDGFGAKSDPKAEYNDAAKTMNDAFDGIVDEDIFGIEAKFESTSAMASGIKKAIESYNGRSSVASLDAAKSSDRASMKKIVMGAKDNETKITKAYNDAKKQLEMLKKEIDKISGRIVDKEAKFDDASEGKEGKDYKSFKSGRYKPTTSAGKASKAEGDAAFKEVIDECASIVKVVNAAAAKGTSMVAGRLADYQACIKKAIAFANGNKSDDENKDEKK